MEGGRLSRPRHCSKSAQPVPKAVYHSSCRSKHDRPQCDSNLDPLTLQSNALTARLLRPSLIRVDDRNESAKTSPQERVQCRVIQWAM